MNDKARELLRLHTDPSLLVLVNVWDVASAKVVADLPGCAAIATASYAIAAAHGYPDGEQIPPDLMLDTVGRIAAAVDLPVTADLEAGYGDVDTTIRRAVDAGVVGANLEDAMRPLPEAVAAVEAAVKAGGPGFVLNARTDQFLSGPGDVDDAIARGRAFLDAGAACVFVPGARHRDTIARLVEGIGERKVSLMGMPGMPSNAELESLGVARLSFGPSPHRAALTALADTGTALLAGGPFPDGIRPLT
ncbi:isocitrate lyase/PEP mutase family protein [Allorhizocola rhizosphaerae]|uniref:isocitrate lyase/PEP mutase family protein n=1 Tax=Allorhizocola rhizosphaerae TaxID=1872709 RepID=UPI000E3C8E65|nr:isocitrate lyase/phosphoenolpyruvate mutase family protein [Allorhizocola rhizosphaerae]